MQMSKLPPPKVCDNCSSTNIIFQVRETYSRYECLDCRASVRCHKGTRLPMGYMAGAATKRLRALAHELVDPIHKRGILRRTEVYALLKEKFPRGGQDYHISQLCREELHNLIGYAKSDLAGDASRRAKKISKERRKIVKRARAERGKINARLNSR